MHAAAFKIALMMILLIAFVFQVGGFVHDQHEGYDKRTKMIFAIIGALVFCFTALLGTLEYRLVMELMKLHGGLL